MKSSLIYISLAIGFALLYVTQVNVGARDQKVRRTLATPPENVKLMTFGYDEVLADSLWIRTIQDIDVCKAVDPDNAEKYKKGYVAPLCNDSWVYRMINAVTDLAPKFRMPYATGAVFLSVAINDQIGAKKIFDKALVQFPTDWSIAYRAAYHYIYELKDFSRGAELLIQAGKNGAPEWVYSLASNIYTKAGQAFLAKSIVEDMLEKDPNSKVAPRLRERLTEINKVLDEEKRKSP